MSSQSTLGTATVYSRTRLPSRVTANRAGGLPESLWVQKIPGNRRLWTIPDASRIAGWASRPIGSSRLRRRLPDRQRQSDQSDHVHGRAILLGRRPAHHRIRSARIPPLGGAPAVANEKRPRRRGGAVAEARSARRRNPSLSASSEATVEMTEIPPCLTSIGRGESRRDRGSVVEEAEYQPHGGIRVVRRARRRIDVIAPDARRRVRGVMGVQLGRLDPGGIPDVEQEVARRGVVGEGVCSVMTMSNSL